jgi:hypothetical protein
MNDQNEILNKTTPLEVNSKDVDEFDVAIDAERERTKKAQEAAEYNRKKYAQAKNVINEKDDRIAELNDLIQRKNDQIAKGMRADREARNNQVEVGSQQRNFSK